MSKVKTINRKSAHKLSDFRPGAIRLFVAGGITDCPDWQTLFIHLLTVELGETVELDCYNPRTPDFDVSRTDESRMQIVWEHRALQQADIISFWFPEETLCAITLFELGAWLNSDKPITVATHENYARRFDVGVQSKLARPGIPLGNSLYSLVSHTAAAIKKLHNEKI